MEREREEAQGKDGWTLSRGMRSEPPSATRDETSWIEKDGEELPRLSPGVGCDSTAQGDKVNVIRIVTYYTLPPLESPISLWIAMAFSR